MGFDFGAYKRIFRIYSITISKKKLFKKAISHHNHNIFKNQRQQGDIKNTKKGTQNMKKQKRRNKKLEETRPLTPNA